MARRVVLVGFMGAGKSTVGRVVARALGWRFVDLDEAVEERVGRSIPRIFREDGEAYFRSLEASVAADLLAEDDLVLAAGGGWAAAQGRLRALPAATVSVWLRVSPEEAVRRATAQPGTRPLLEGEDPLEGARILLREREPSYGDADGTVDTDGSSVEDVSARVLQILAKLGIESSAE